MDMLGLDIGDVINGIYLSFIRLCESIIAPFKAAWELVSSLFDIWEDDTTTFIDKICQTFKAILTFLLFPFVQLWQNIKGLGKAILELFELIINGLINCIDWVIGKIIETCKDIFAFITSTFTQFWQYIKDGFESLVTDVSEIFTGLYESLINPVNDGIDWIKNKFSELIDWFNNIYSNLSKKFTSKFKKYFSWTGLFDDDKDKEQVKTTIIEHPNSLNTNNANAAAMNRVSSKVNNNAVTINNTMHVSTPQEGFDNLNNLAKNEIQNVADNTQTALGAN